MKNEFLIKLGAQINNNADTVKQLNLQVKSLEKQVKSLELKVSMPTKATKGFGDLNTQLKNLKISMSDFQNNMLSTNSTFDTVTTRYTNNAGKILTVQEKLIDGEKRYKLSLKEVGNAVETNAKQADKWNYSWSKAFQSFTTYMSVSTVFYQTVRTIRDMINEVVELDGALVELQKVTDLNGASLDEFTKRAYEAATTVAKTGTEMVNAATEFAKAGYDESQILQLGELALMYTNIADEAVSAAESAEFMIAQMKAFNIESEDAMHIIDAVNEVSNNFAVSSADIANNLGKSSAVMANAGNSYEQMIGLLTAGTEITRNASKVSNGLKTITLRLQGMNDEGEEDLELVAQMSTLYDKLGISVYNSNGELKNTYELLATLAPIYKDATAAEKAYITETIAGKYQAQNAAAILNNFSTAIEATETAMNSTGSTTRENAKVVDSIQGKISGLQSAFEELSQTVVNSDMIKIMLDLGTALLKIANSDISRFVMSFATLSIVLKGLGMGGEKVLLVFSNFYDKVVKNVKLLQDYAKYSKLASQATKISGDNFTMASKSVTALTTAEQAQVLQDGKLLVSKMALSAALAGVTLAITVGASVWRHYQQSKQEALDNAVNSAETIKNETKEIDAQISKISELRATIDDSSSSYENSKSARESLKSIQDTLIQQYGEEAEALDLVNGNLEKQLDLVNKLTSQDYQNWLNKNQGAIEEAQEALSNTVDKGTLFYEGELITNAGKNSWDKTNFMANWGKNNGYDVFAKNGLGSGTLYSGMNDTETLEYLNKFSEYLQKNKQAVLDAGLTEEDYKDILSDVGKEITTITDKYAEYHKIMDFAQEAKIKSSPNYSAFEDELKQSSDEGFISEDDFQKILDKYPDVKQALQDIGNDYSILGIKISESNKDIAENANTIVDAYTRMSQARQDFGNSNSADKLFTDDFLGDANNNYIKELYNGLKDIADRGDLSAKAIRDFVGELDNWEEVNGELVYDLDGTTVSIQDLITYFSVLNDETRHTAEYFEGISDVLDNIQSAYDLATTALEEYNNQGYLSIDTLQALADLDSQYLELLFNESNQLEINKTGFSNLAIAQLNLLKIKQQEKLLDYVDSLKGEGSQLDNNTDIVNNLTEALQKNNAALATNIALSSANGDFTDEEVEAVEKRVKAVIAYYQSVDKTISKISSGAGFISGSTSKDSSSSSSKEWWEIELEKLKEQFKYNEITIEQYINGLNNLLGRVKQGTEAWREINAEFQKQRLTKVEDDYKRGTISLDEYIKKLKELIKAYKEGSEAWRDLADKIKDALQEKLDKQKEDLETAKDAAINIIDKEIEKQQELKDEIEKRYDEEIEALKEKNEETERAIELARLEEALENAKKEKTKRVWREGIGWVWEADQEAIKDAEDALNDFNNENAIKDLEEKKEQELEAIDDIIDGWEEYKKAWEDVVNDYEDEQDRLILLQKLGADIENSILQQKIDAVNKYKEAYLNTMKELEKLEGTPSDELNGYNMPSDNNTSNSGASGSSSSKAPALNKGSYISVKPGTKWYANSYGGGASGKARSGTIRYINSGGSHPYNIDGLGWIKKTDIVGYRNGGIVDYTGLAMLHGTKSKPEFVLNNDQMKNMLSTFIRPQTTSAVSNNNSSVSNYNFGNIELPNVSNANQFVTELKSLVNITKHQ